MCGVTGKDIAYSWGKHLDPILRCKLWDLGMLENVILMGVHHTATILITSVVSFVIHLMLIIMVILVEGGKPPIINAITAIITITTAALLLTMAVIITLADLGDQRILSH